MSFLLDKTAGSRSSHRRMDHRKWGKFVLTCEASTVDHQTIAFLQEIFASSFARKAVDLLKSRLYTNRDVVQSQIKWNTQVSFEGVIFHIVPSGFSAVDVPYVSRQHRKMRSKYLNGFKKNVRNSRKLSDRFDCYLILFIANYFFCCLNAWLIAFFWSFVCLQILPKRHQRWPNC